MTEVEPDKKIALLEYIGHLSTSDWDGVVADLYNLGFIPPGTPDLRENGMSVILGRILEQVGAQLLLLVGWHSAGASWTRFSIPRCRQVMQGGGAAKINIESVTREVEKLSAEYEFIIPPYFALILRCFSVIEASRRIHPLLPLAPVPLTSRSAQGIALRVDPDYAIVSECFPYLVRRLLEDDSPRARAALRQLLYGSGRRLDISRLRRMADGFGSFTTDGLTSRGTGAPSTSGRAATGSAAPALAPQQQQALLDRTSREALRTIFRKEGSYVQELLVDELVASVDALSRESFLELARIVLGSAGTTVTLQAVEALGPLRPLVLPLPLPVEMLARFAPAVRLDEEDRIALDNIRSIWELLQPQLTVRGPRISSQLAGSEPHTENGAGEHHPCTPERRADTGRVGHRHRDGAPGLGDRPGDPEDQRPLPPGPGEEGGTAVGRGHCPRAAQLCERGQHAPSRPQLVVGFVRACVPRAPWLFAPRATARPAYTCIPPCLPRVPWSASVDPCASPAIGPLPDRSGLWPVVSFFLSRCSSGINSCKFEQFMQDRDALGQGPRTLSRTTYQGPCLISGLLNPKSRCQLEFPSMKFLDHGMSLVFISDLAKSASLSTPAKKAPW